MVTLRMLIAKIRIHDLKLTLLRPVLRVLLELSGGGPVDVSRNYPYMLKVIRTPKRIRSYHGMNLGMPRWRALIG